MFNSNEEEERREGKAEASIMGSSILNDFEE